MGLASQASYSGEKKGNRIYSELPSPPLRDRAAGRLNITYMEIFFFFYGKKKERRRRKKLAGHIIS
jgi:hypothetical protein